uniref:G-protein coupled receptors family 1 profile domain-containing protein n=1 Tax=Parascaris univalens TaxID=6257 RepID=A0A915B284_PARUN
MRKAAKIAYEEDAKSFLQAYCQSCINPVCYAFISQNFRTTFKSAYSRMCLNKKSNDGIRSRCYSRSSLSPLSTRQIHRHQTTNSLLTVPNRNGTVIAPTLSLAVSQLSPDPSISSRCSSPSVKTLCPAEGCDRLML